MKITIEQHEETITFEAKNDDLTTHEFVEVLYRILHTIGYHRKSINEAFMGLADELEVEEDRIARENHEAIEQEDYEMRKAMEKDTYYGPMDDETTSHSNGFDYSREAEKQRLNHKIKEFKKEIEN